MRAALVMEEWWGRLRRRWCRHEGGAVYEEVRLAGTTREHLSWTAMWCCPACGEVLRVEASFSGDRRLLARAMEEELGGER